MQTKIIIEGQISGNHRLLNAILQPGATYRDGMFYSKIITFKTKSAARKALWLGLKSLKQEEPEFVKMSDYSPKYGTLKYDASKAHIIQE